LQGSKLHLRSPIPAPNENGEQNPDFRFPADLHRLEERAQSRLQRSRMGPDDVIKDAFEMGAGFPRAKQDSGMSTKRSTMSGADRQIK
jgi:hypothetical protein